MKDIKFKTPVYLNEYHEAGTFVESTPVTEYICEICGDSDWCWGEATTRSELISFILEDLNLTDEENSNKVSLEELDWCLSMINNEVVKDFPLEGGKVTIQDILNYNHKQQQ